MSKIGKMLLSTAVMHNGHLIISLESIMSLAGMNAICIADAISYAKILGIAVNYAF